MSEAGFKIVRMFEYVDVDRLDAGAALGVLEQAQRAKRRAEVQEALAMVRVVKTYRHQIPTDKVQLGGEGTGLVEDVYKRQGRWRRRARR